MIGFLGQLSKIEGTYLFDLFFGSKHFKKTVGGEPFIFDVLAGYGQSLSAAYGLCSPVAEAYLNGLKVNQ